MKVSGGLVLCRRKQSVWQIFLLHAGGPFYAHRDDGAWTIPKGEVAPGEDPKQTAWREFTEETGFRPPSSEAVPLPPLRVTPGKTLHRLLNRATDHRFWRCGAMALLCCAATGGLPGRLAEGDADPALLRSGAFEWKGRAYPEADRAAWFSLEQSRAKLFRGQVPLLHHIRKALPGLG